MINMREELAVFTLCLYGLAVVGKELLIENKIALLKINIDVPLAIMCKFVWMNAYESHFVPIHIGNTGTIDLPKPFHLNRKTRPPNIQWAL